MQIQNYVHKHIYSLLTIPYQSALWYVYVHTIKINTLPIKLIFCNTFIFLCLFSYITLANIDIRFLNFYFCIAF